jgi:hypothetical protein
MKKLLTMLIMLTFISACSPKIGSKEWCKAMEEKPKADWTMTEIKDFAKHCIFSNEE